jgi:MGT family glycosyltransferase
VARLLLGAFGDPGHAFPMLALGERLAARGHAVALETWERWRDHAEAGGLAFVAAPEWPVFPRHGEALNPYEAVARSVVVTRPAVASFAPDVVVHDVLTLAPALAAELEGVPRATLVPHVHPAPAPGAPPYSLGARMPRTRAGRAMWARLRERGDGGYRRGRAELNAVRARLGLPPQERLLGGLSSELVMVGALPQLEYPRPWRAWEHVVGPLLWEPPAADVEPPPGDAPLVVVAPSTAQDPQHRLLRAALAGLERMPVRVLATWNRRPLDRPVRVPANARVVEWISYERTMARADVVVCHGGAGTVARALSAGAVTVVVPAAGDQNENAARVDWAGAGVRLPWRLLAPATLSWAVARALGEPRLRARARAIGAWSAEHDGAQRAADLVEVLAVRGRAGAREGAVDAEGPSAPVAFRPRSTAARAARR